MRNFNVKWTILIGLLCLPSLAGAVDVFTMNTRLFTVTCASQDGAETFRFAQRFPKDGGVMPATVWLDRGVVEAVGANGNVVLGVGFGIEMDEDDPFRRSFEANRVPMTLAQFISSIDYVSDPVSGRADFLIVDQPFAPGPGQIPDSTPGFAFFDTMSIFGRVVLDANGDPATLKLKIADFSRVAFQSTQALPPRECITYQTLISTGVTQDTESPFDSTGGGPTPCSPIPCPVNP